MDSKLLLKYFLIMMSSNYIIHSIVFNVYTCHLKITLNYRDALSTDMEDAYLTLLALVK